MKPVRYNPWGTVDVYHKMFQTSRFFSLDRLAFTYTFTLTLSTWLKGAWNPVDNLRMKEGTRSSIWVLLQTIKLWYSGIIFQHDKLWSLNQCSCLIALWSQQKGWKCRLQPHDTAQADTRDTCWLQRSFQTLPGERVCLCLRFLFAENDLEAWWEEQNHVGS